MRKYALLIAAFVAVLALPSGASAHYDCSAPEGSDPVEVETDPASGVWISAAPAPGYVHIYEGHSHYTWTHTGTPPGEEEPDNPIGGVCWDTGVGDDTGFYGGSFEAGTDADGGTQPDTDPDGGSVKNDGDGAYAVLDGDDRNDDPSGEGDGYIGVSNYESNEDTDDNCQDGSDNDPDEGSNSGWCTYIGPEGSGVGVPTPIVGGSDSGPSYDDTDRDGWRVP